MTRLGTTMRWIVLAAFAFAPNLWAQTQRAPILEKIVKTYGIDSWDKVEAIRYTMNAKGAVNTSRTWMWEPKTDRVSYDGKDKDGKPVKLTYLRSEVGSQKAAVKDETDRTFNIDQYNLLFPLHLFSLDSGAKVEDTGIHKLPIGKGSATRVVVTYSSEGGYTPGDVWEVFVAPDNRIREVAYHRGKDPKPFSVFSLEDYRKAGPLLVSLNRAGTLNGKPERFFFSDVAVKLVGSDTWMKAQ